MEFIFCKKCFIIYIQKVPLSRSQLTIDPIQLQDHPYSYMHNFASVVWECFVSVTNNRTSIDFSKYWYEDERVEW